MELTDFMFICDYFSQNCGIVDAIFDVYIKVHVKRRVMSQKNRKEKST